MTRELLRLEEEPCVSYSDVEIHDTLCHNVTAFMNYMENFYKIWQREDDLVELPQKQLFEVPYAEGDFRIMPCLIHGDYRIKSVKIIGTNEENRTVHDKISVGKSFLIHPYDNYIHAMFDACVLSSFRTAAISVLAYKTVVSDTTNPTALTGTGRIGFYTALILHRYLDVQDFFCYDPNLQNRQNFEKLASLYLPDAQVHFLPLEKLGENANSLFVATNSHHAIFDKTSAEAFAFVSSVGADADNLSELDSSILANRTVVTDSRQSVMLGDLKRWQEKGLLSEANLVELKEIIGEENIRNKEPFLFISTGIAVQDALTAQFICNTTKHTKGETTCSALSMP